MMFRKYIAIVSYLGLLLAGKGDSKDGCPPGQCKNEDGECVPCDEANPKK